MDIFFYDIILYIDSKKSPNFEDDYDNNNSNISINKSDDYSFNNFYEEEDIYSILSEVTIKNKNDILIIIQI